VRPVFSDGAILGAADLTALAQLDRDRDARHARHLHTPGVAAGLELTSEARATETGTAYLEVTLQPGYAVDGTGRELVVAAPLPVSPERFGDDTPIPIVDPTRELTTVWYPVFVRGVDTSLAATNGQIGCQGSGGLSRIAEDVEIEFGRPGDASAEQPLLPPDAGPGDGSWRVLVGFVRFQTDIKRFIEVTATADGVRVPTAGARAGLVAGQSGRVELRPRQAAVAGVPAVVLDDKTGGSLVFGLHTGTGTVAPLMTVDTSGNLVVTGTIGAVQDSVLVAAGAAFDGTVLPLPAGADLAAIKAGTVQVSVLVSPRHPDVGSQLSSTDRFITAECRVDEERRVHCWGTWFPPGGTGSANNDAGVTRDVPAACDYLVLLSVPRGGA